MGFKRVVERKNVPKVLSGDFVIFQTFGTVASTEMKHTQNKLMGFRERCHVVLNNTAVDK
jgi:hypothetical protein